jgi:hypothetical protein
LKPEDSEQTLRNLLVEHGLNFSAPDPLVAWEAFKQFLLLPIVEEGITDGALFQCGVFNFTGANLFHLDFVRQYEYSDADGEYESMEQVHCELMAHPSVDLKRIKTNLWLEDCASLQDFFNQVESLPEFQVAIRHSPYTLDVSHEQV